MPSKAERNYESNEAAHNWIMNYCQTHGVNYSEGYRALGKQIRADQISEDAKAQRAYTARATFVRNYMSETGATKRQSENHVDKFMPNLRRYGVAIQTASSYVNNPGGNDPEICMRLFREFFSSERDLARTCASEWVVDVVNRLMQKRAPTGFKSKNLAEYTREVLGANPDIAEAYETGRMSEAAIRQIFHFRFGDEGYNVWDNHG
jgi:hypothetical protein